MSGLVAGSRSLPISMSGIGGHAPPSKGVVLRVQPRPSLRSGTCHPRGHTPSLNSLPFENNDLPASRRLMPLPCRETMLLFVRRRHPHSLGLAAHGPQLLVPGERHSAFAVRQVHGMIRFGKIGPGETERDVLAAQDPDGNVIAAVHHAVAPDTAYRARPSRPIRRRMTCRTRRSAQVC